MSIVNNILVGLIVGVIGAAGATYTSVKIMDNELRHVNDRLLKIGTTMEKLADQQIVIATNTQKIVSLDRRVSALESLK